MSDVVLALIKENNLVVVLIVFFFIAIFYRIATKDDPISVFKKIFKKSTSTNTITPEQINSLGNFINSTKNWDKLLDEIVSILKKLAVIVDNGVASINDDLAYRIFRNTIRDAQYNILNVVELLIKQNNIGKNEVDFRKQMDEKIDGMIIELRKDLDPFIVTNKNDSKIFKLSDWVEINKNCLKVIGSQCIDKIKDQDKFEDIKVFVFNRIDSFASNLRKDVDVFVNSNTSTQPKKINQSNQP